MTDLRHARTSDHRPIVDAIQRWWGDSRTPEQARELALLVPKLFLQHFAGTSLVLEDDGRMAGFLVGFHSADHPAEAYIHFVGVDPAYRGRGLARRLYTAFFDHAAAAGRTTVRAVTSPGNAGSIAFHRSLGFELVPGDDTVDGVPVHTGYDGRGHSRVCFRRVIGGEERPPRLADHVPLLGLRLTTPRLELRLPAPDELAALADLAAEGIHDPALMPFRVPWTDQEPAEIARGVAQHHWLALGRWQPEDWALNLAVFHAGTVVGLQSVEARDFAVTREVGTGSWLGKRHQGRGIGTEMRAAVLHLAFAWLGAEEAKSGAFGHNTASLTVSRKLGYRPDGVARHEIRGELAVEHRMRLTRADWERHRTVPVTVEGLDPCLSLFGLTSQAVSAGHARE